MDGSLTEQQLNKIGKIAWPLECSAAHGVEHPDCTLIGEQQSGMYIYEYYVDSSKRYWYKEYVLTEDGKRVPFDDYVWGPIREKARRNIAYQRERQKEQQKPYLSEGQQIKRQNDLAALRQRFESEKIQKN